MRGKKTIGKMIFGLALCMSAFFVPMTAYADENEEHYEDADSMSAVGELVAVSDGKEDEPVAGRSSNPLTPDGQATVLDNVAEADGKEFYTFITPEGNVFYLVIDHERETENVYFLNAVTEQDLYALAKKADGESTGSESAIPELPVCSCGLRCVPGRVDVSCAVCKNDLTGCVGRAEEVPGEESPAPGDGTGGSGADGSGATAGGEVSGGKSNAGMYLVVILAVAVVGGAGYYFKIYRPKHELDDAEDLDELLADGGDEDAEGDLSGDRAMPETDGDSRQYEDGRQLEDREGSGSDLPENGGYVYGGMAEDYDDLPDDYADGYAESAPGEGE